MHESMNERMCACINAAMLVAEHGGLVSGEMCAHGCVAVSGVLFKLLLVCAALVHSLGGRGCRRFMVPMSSPPPFQENSPSCP